MTPKIRIAEIISRITIPGLTITIFFLYLGIVKPAVFEPLPFVLSILLLGILPVVATLIGSKKAGEGGGVHIASRSARTLPYIISLVGSLLCLVILLLLEGSGVYVFIAGSFVVSTVILLLVNFLTKVSVHMCAVSAAAGLCLCLTGVWSIPFLILMALVFWSRLSLGKHTWQQLVLGMIIGFVTPLCIWFFL